MEPSPEITPNIPDQTSEESMQDRTVNMDLSEKLEAINPATIKVLEALFKSKVPIGYVPLLKMVSQDRWHDIDQLIKSGVIMSVTTREFIGDSVVVSVGGHTLTPHGHIIMEALFELSDRLSHNPFRL